MSNIKGIEGMFRAGGPTYEVLKEIEAYLINDMGNIPSDTCFYTLADVDEDEVTFYTNAEIIIASNEFKGYIFAYEHVHLTGVLKYTITDRCAAILDAHVDPSARCLGVFKDMHKLYLQIIPSEMSSFTLNVNPRSDKKRFDSENELSEEEYTEQLKINKDIATSLGYNDIDEENLIARI